MSDLKLCLHNKYMIGTVTICYLERDKDTGIDFICSIDDEGTYRVYLIYPGVEDWFTLKDI